MKMVFQQAPRISICNRRYIPIIQSQKMIVAFGIKKYINTIITAIVNVVIVSFFKRYGFIGFHFFIPNKLRQSSKLCRSWIYSLFSTKVIFLVGATFTLKSKMSKRL